MTEKILAWHFAGKDRKLRYCDGRKIIKGRTITIEGDPILCTHGLHASIRLIDALVYATGPVISRVEISGTIVHGNDKIAGTERKCIWWIDATNILHEFACRCAESALEKTGVRDERSWNVIRAKRAWLRCEATIEQLDAARYAAEYAAESAQSAAEFAAQSAAQSAAWSAAQFVAQFAAQSAAEFAAQSAAQFAAQSAAQFAAQSAAEFAAQSAAEFAAQSAAWSAAQFAAQFAAQSAACSAAREDQNAMLENMAEAAR